MQAANIVLQIMREMTRKYCRLGQVKKEEGKQETRRAGIEDNLYTHNTTLN
jgi:hypothetical protein